MPYLKKGNVFLDAESVNVPEKAKLFFEIFIFLRRKWSYKKNLLFEKRAAAKV